MLLKRRHRGTGAGRVPVDAHKPGPTQPLPPPVGASPVPPGHRPCSRLLPPHPLPPSRPGRCPGAATIRFLFKKSSFVRFYITCLQSRAGDRRRGGDGNRGGAGGGEVVAHRGPADPERFSQGLVGGGRREAVGLSPVGEARGCRRPGGSCPFCISRSTSAKEGAAGDGGGGGTGPGSIARDGPYYRGGGWSGRYHCRRGGKGWYHCCWRRAVPLQGSSGVTEGGGAKPPRCQVMGDAAGSDGWRGAEPLTLWLPWRCCWLSLCSCFCPVSSPGTIKSSPGMTETGRGEGVRRLSITQPVAVAAGTACP